MNNNTLYNLSRMNVSEFRKFKAALRILTSAGMDFNTAIEILVSGWAVRKYDQIETRIARRHVS